MASGSYTKSNSWEVVSLLIAAEEMKINRTHETEVETMNYFCNHEGIRNVILECLQNMCISNAKKISEEDTALKCDDVSNRWRMRGNDKFDNGLFRESYECYNKSVIYALKTGPIYSIALANRSASLIKLRRYKECLEDIALAIEFNYPSNLKHKLYLRRSECHVELNELINARVALAAAKEQVNIYALLGEEAESFDEKVKFLNRKISNLSINESRPDDVYLPSCFNGDNPDFEAASKAVELRYSTSVGRCVVAKEALCRGDILFSEEPYAWIALSGDRPTCEMCCAADINPVPCNLCSRSLYCNDKCRSLAAVSFHKWECIGSQCGFYKITGIGHLALRVLLLTAERGFPVIPNVSVNSPMTAADMFIGYEAIDKIQIYNRDYPAFYRMFNLMSNMNKMNNGDYILYAVTATMLHLYLEYFTTFFDYLPTRIPYKLSASELRIFSSAIIFRSIGQLVCNGHSITGLMTCTENEAESGNSFGRITTDVEIFRGTAIYPSAAMMNHSCDPNIVSNFYKNRLLVKSSRELPSGSEVLNCYGPNRARECTESRRAALRAQYMFTCNCGSCSETDRRDFTSLFVAYACQTCKGPVLWVDKIFRCQQCQAVFNKDAGIEKLERANELMNQAESTTNVNKRLEIALQSFRLKQRVLHHHNIALRAAADRLARMYAECGDFTRSADLIKQNVQCCENQYGSFSVEVAHELKKLSHVMVEKINSTPGFMDFREWCLEANRIVKKAINLMELNYGSWEPVIKILRLQEAFIASVLESQNALLRI